MFNSIALNVIIGLVFIYLLYSLLATILSEMIATKLGLRARNLKEAIDRMLNDEQEQGWFHRLWDSMKMMKNPSNPIVDSFYNHPEIKYLGSSGVFKMPSSFKATSFSKTILNLLFGDSPVTKEKIDAALNEIVKNADGKTDAEKEKKILDPETAKYIQNLWNDSYGDVVKFKVQLEGWFDRTMEQALVWYKRKIQIVTFILGFCIAWFFCVDTFSIIKKLSFDKDARDQLVSMANAYVQNNKTLVITPGADSTEVKTYTQKLDSLLEVKKKLDTDIANASSLLGLGGWLPDTVQVFVNKNQIIYIPPVDNFICKDKKVVKGKIAFSSGDKWNYFFGLLFHHFWGFLITAIAISLGAPFWFDLLNKLMKLRTSQKEPTDSTTKATGNVTISSLDREA